MKARSKWLCAVVVGIAFAVTVGTAALEGQDLRITRGCYAGRDVSNASGGYSFESWYADSADTGGRYGLNAHWGEYGMWIYCTMLAPAGNANDIVVTRYLDDVIVAKDYIVPGGALAEYIACDSLAFTKTASDTFNYKLCW